MEINVQLSEKLLKQISALWPNPVGILNTNGVVLAHTLTHLCKQVLKPALVLIQDNLPEVVIPQSAKTANALPGIYVPIIVANTTVGVLLVHYSEQEDMLPTTRMLQEICQLNMESYISGNYLNVKRYERTSFYMNWLENGFSSDSNNFGEQASLNQVDVEAGVICAILHMPQVLLDQSLKYSITEALEQFAIPYILRDVDFVLVFNTQSYAKVENKLTHLQRAIQGTVPRYLIAVGQAYGCLNLFCSYQEALKLIYYYGKTADGVLFFKDELLNVYLYDAPETLKKQFIQQVFSDYTEKELLQIYEFIQTYIACNGSIQQISNRLFVHKNTIQYRIEQLYKRTGYDLRKTMDCQILSVACKWMF